MNFYTIRDLSTMPRTLWDNLSSDGEVITTNKDKPTALLLDIADGDLEEVFKAVGKEKVIMAFNSMKSKAAKKGYMSEDEIQDEINRARKGR